MANKMATTRNTIATIIHVIFVASLSASCSEVDEVGVCAAKPFTILSKRVAIKYCNKWNQAKGKVDTYPYNGAWTDSHSTYSIKWMGADATCKM